MGVHIEPIDHLRREKGTHEPFSRHFHMGHEVSFRRILSLASKGRQGDQHGEQPAE